MSATIALPSSVATRSGTRRPFRLWPEWLTLSLYAAIVAYAIPFHEPWADEAQAWQLAGHNSLFHLIIVNLRYEGHPALWYVLLKCLQHLGAPYAGMQWLAGAIAAISAALLIFCAPFPRIARLTLPFTFFLAYQYAVVARSYVLIPLLLFSIAMVWRRKSALLPAALLGLLANVSLHAASVSFGLAIVYFWESRERNPKPEHRSAALAALVTLFAVATLTVAPQPRDLMVSTAFDGIPRQLAPMLWLFQAVIYVARGFVSRPWFVGLFGFGTLLWSVWGVLPKRYLASLVFLAAAGGYFCSFWHLGVMTVTCIALAWIAWPVHPVTKPKRVVAQFAFLLAVVPQLAYTVHALVCDHYLPYSGDLAAANFLSPFVKAGTPMAVTYVNSDKDNAFFSVGLRPYLPGPVFINETSPFWEFTTTKHTRVAFEAALKQHPPIIVVEYSDRRLRPFDLQRETYSRAISHLRQQGYVLTRTFCGVRPEDLRDRRSLCHLIYQLPSSASDGQTAVTSKP